MPANMANFSIMVENAQGFTERLKADAVMMMPKIKIIM